MHLTYYLVLASLIYCNIVCIFHLFRVIGLGNPNEFAKKAGNKQKGIFYAYTAAMNPLKKESAYLNWFTYIAGILYHIGTFTSLVILVVIIINTEPSIRMSQIFSPLLIITGLSGLAILIKRIISSNMRILSNPDDYFSNALVTIFHFATALTLSGLIGLPVYYIISSLLLIYIPIGKLKHTVYFFTARYHLGLFYGWRGVWPPK